MVGAACRRVGPEDQHVAKLAVLRLLDRDDAPAGTGARMIAGDVAQHVSDDVAKPLASDLGFTADVARALESVADVTAGRLVQARDGLNGRTQRERAFTLERCEQVVY